VRRTRGRHRGGLLRALLASSLVAAFLGLAPRAAGDVADPGTSGPTLLDIAIPAVHGPIEQKWLPYAGVPRAKVLLPAGYDPGRQYPLLVLLEGLTSNYTMWAADGMGQVAKTAAGLDAIIVMPEGGNGWYTDWWNKGRRGGPSWESYILDDVIPTVLADFPIRPGRRWHALGGDSMGGLGTAYLGGRLPGFFGSIAVFSGLADTHIIYGQGELESFIPQYLAKTSIDPQAVYGPEFGFYSIGHDPTRLAANLQHTRVFATVGNGIKTDDGEPFDDAPTDAPAEGLIIRTAMNKYAQALRAAGVDVTYRTHNGAHSWPNFRQELRAAIAWGLFAPVEDDPTSWVNDTVATHGVLWGVGYRFAAGPDALVRFRRSGSVLTVSRAGSPVTLTLPGGCTVTTPTPATVPLTCG
jgi:S-formylglutathione hydrolase FrmB